MEEINMLVAEWDMATALEVEREEGYEKGLKEAALNAFAEGVPIELVSKITRLDIEKVRELSSIQA
jgi:predicted transposase YdaD